MTSPRVPSTPDASAQQLRARTTELVTASLPAALVELLPAQDPMAWLRRGEGIVAWGVAARRRTSGPDRFADASDWWRELVAAAEVHDEVALPGTGLVALGSFAFADEPGDSVLVVPRVVVGTRGGRSWVTVVDDLDPTDPTGPADPQDAAAPTAHRDSPAVPDLRAQDAPRPPRDVTFADGAISGAAWEGVVADAVARINAGELEKVVLARDLVATATEDVDVRWPLRRLASEYAMCWTFHVDGLFGATPEMLVRRERGLVTSRVLAGTIRRTGDESRDAALAGQLARSSKDLEEHEYAVRSVAEALAPYCSSTNVPEVPFVLHLPNVMHLATDVAGVVHDGPEGRPEGQGATVLELAAALHPSAAVGGTPTKVAVELIAEIEGMERGRYAGPVGWMDAAGDGEFGIALRSAELTGPQVRLFAGCGVVASSDPASELAEAQAKFLPVRDAITD